MKRWIILILTIIFGTSILSAYMTYKSTSNLKNDTKNISEHITLDDNNTTIEEVAGIENTETKIEEKEEIVRENNSTKEVKKITEVKEIKKKDDSKIETKKVEESNNIKTETVEVKETEKAQTIKNEQKEETKVSNDYVEVKVDIVEKKECQGNNHKMGAGNTELWFETKAQADNYYNSQIEKWGKLWENDEITKEEYLKKCPSGYEVWTCPQCKKWTINFYYR